MEGEAVERMFARFEITDGVVDAEDELRTNKADFSHGSVDFFERFEVVGDRVLVRHGRFA